VRSGALSRAPAPYLPCGFHWPGPVRTCAIPRLGASRRAARAVRKGGHVRVSIERRHEPLALLVAMASGIASVASSTYGIPKVTQHLHYGLLMPPGDLGALRAAMGRLATDGALREQLGRNARATVLEKFTWRAQAREVVRVYESLLEQRPPREATQERALLGQAGKDDV
jgi:glycosyltransferase involved in cell wall biosynthesis